MIIKEACVDDDCFKVAQASRHSGYVRRYIFRLVEDGRCKIVIMNLAKTGNQSTSVHVWHVQSELSLHLSQGDKNFLLELTCL